MKREDHKFSCLNEDVVRCDECDEKFCRGCDEESKTDFDEGTIKCGLCIAIGKRISSGVRN